jgi:hypothetical protein
MPTPSNGGAITYTGTAHVDVADNLSFPDVLSPSTSSTSARLRSVFGTPLSTSTSLSGHQTARLSIRTSTITARDRLEARNEIAVVGALAGVVFVLMVTFGVIRGWKWRKSMLQILYSEKVIYKNDTPELPTSYTTHEKDGQEIRDADVGQRYELDAQSDRSFRTRLSRAFSFKKRLVVDKITVESGRPASDSPSSRSNFLPSELPAMPKAALVMEAIILPELPAKSTQIDKPGSAVAVKELEGTEKAEAEKMGADRLQSLKAEEEEIQKILSDLRSRKAPKDDTVEEKQSSVES